MRPEDDGGGSPCAAGMALSTLIVLAGMLSGCGPPTPSQLRAEHHSLRAARLSAPPPTRAASPEAPPSLSARTASDQSTPDLRTHDAETSRQEAIRLAEAGHWREALAEARRAAEQDPAHPGNDALAVRVMEIGRLRHFDLVFAEARQDLVEGRLVAAESRIASLSALGVGQDRLERLREDVDRARVAVETTLRTARDLRARGEFAAATHWYDAAAAAVADDPSIAAERQACAAEREMTLTGVEARQAFETGRFEEAAALYSTLLVRRGDPDTEAALRRSTAAALRVTVHEALAEGAVMDALEALDRLLALDSDEELAALRDRLRRQVVRATLERAGDLDAAGRPDAAVELLARSLARVPDLHMQERLRELTPRAWLARATAADRDGRFIDARDLYLRALTVLPGRAGVAERISDVQALAALHERAERAEAATTACFEELDALTSLLAARERDLRDTRDDLRCREAELEDLADDHARLAAHVDRSQYGARHVDMAMAALRDEKEQLCRAIDRARRDAEHWRRKYDRERARRDD